VNIGKLPVFFLAAKFPFGAFCFALLLYLLPDEAFSQGSSGHVVSADKRALVIGNTAYRENKYFAKLPHSRADADDVTTALRGLGYVVIERKDETAEELERTVLDFAKNAANAQIAIFYFSGHGVQVNNENILLGINADGTLFDKDNRKKLDTYGLNLDDPLSAFRIAQIPVKLFIFDACREVVAAKGGPVGLKGAYSGAKGSLIAYATAPDTAAFDDPRDHNSIYTKYLLLHLNDPVDLVTIFLKTQDDVAQQTAYAQLPWLSFSPGLLGLGITNVPDKIPPEQSKLVVDGAETDRTKGPLPSSEPDSPLLEDDPVKKFLQQHWEHLEEQNVDAYLSDYFNPVEWFQQGPTSLDYVRRGVKAAFRRWNLISHHITGPPQITPLSGGGGILVIAPMEFDLTVKSGNHVKGTGKDVFEIRAIKDDSGNVAPKIFSQDQQIDGTKD
jgi:hypothetical protein